MNSIRNQRRYKEINVLYSIGTILVLIGHSHSSDWSTFHGTLLFHAIRFIYTFHMPLFFVIAGFLFFNSHSYDVKGIVKWIEDKATRLLVPYLFWSFIGLVPKYYVENGGLVGLSFSYILGTIVVPRQSIWGHFWFLPVLFLTYSVFALWRKFITDKNAKVMCVFSLIVFCVFYYLPITTDIAGLSDLRVSCFFFSVGVLANVMKEDFCLAVGKMMGTGGGTGRKLLSIVYCVVITVISMVFTEFAYKYRTVGMVIGLLMVSVCVMLSRIIGETKISDWISQHNYTIYIFSWFFQSVAMVVCEHIHMGWEPLFIIMFSVGLLGPTLVILIREKIPSLNRKWVDLVLGMR